MPQRTPREEVDVSGVTFERISGGDASAEYFDTGHGDGGDPYALLLVRNGEAVLMPVDPDEDGNVSHTGAFGSAAERGVRGRYDFRSKTLIVALPDHLRGRKPPRAAIGMMLTALAKMNQKPKTGRIFEGVTRTSFTPPADVAAAARKGLELRKQWKRGGLDASQAAAQGIGSGVVRAGQLANRRPLSLSTVKRMRAFFSRHAKNTAPAKAPDGGPTAGYIAGLLWGGDAGKRWAASVLADHDG